MMGSTSNPEAKQEVAQVAAPRGPGRPSKLTPEIRKQLTGLIVSGQFAVDACAAVGIGSSTFYNWQAKGKAQARGQYRDFLEAIEAAEARRRIVLMEKVTKASKEPRHWQAATWVLTHTDPAKFAPQLRVHVEQELNTTLDRLEQEFKNEPEIYGRILSAIAGGARVSPAAGDQTGKRAREHEEGSAADPSRPLASPA